MMDSQNSDRDSRDKGPQLASQRDRTSIRQKITMHIFVIFDYLLDHQVFNQYVYSLLVVVSYLQ